MSPLPTTREVSLPWGRLLSVVGLLTVVIAAWFGGAKLLDALTVHPGVIVTAVALIGVGELLRAHLPSGRVLAPLSTATTLSVATLADINDHASFDVSASVVVLIVAAGQALALVVRRRLDPDAGEANRLLAAALVAWVWRGIPVDGSTLWSLHASQTAPRWEAAVWLVGAAALGLVAERVINGLIRSLQLHTSLVTSLGDEFQQALPFTWALVSPPPIATLIVPVTGVIGLPLALMPVALTLVAVRRYAAVELTFRQTIRTLSRLTEEGGYTPREHARRTAQLGRAVAQRLDLPDREVREVEYAALLHDLGQLTLTAPIPRGATVLAAPSDQRTIAHTGAAIIRHGTQLDRVAALVERQATPYRAVVELTEDVPMAARILKVVNAFDDHTGGQRSQASISAAIERIHLGLGYEYDPSVVAALESVVATRPWQPVPGAARQQGSDPS